MKVIVLNGAGDVALIAEGDQSLAFAENVIALNPGYSMLEEGYTMHVDVKGVKKILAIGDTIEGFSDVYSPDFSFDKKPDGKGGWVLPPASPAPDATTVLNWKLSAALAAKGVNFIHTDPSIAARWQFEPSFAIDGVVAKALQTSLGYDDAQLQALFNEAAALK